MFCSKWKAFFACAREAIAAISKIARQSRRQFTIVMTSTNGEITWFRLILNSINLLVYGFIYLWFWKTAYVNWITINVDTALLNFPFFFFASSLARAFVSVSPPGSCKNHSHPSRWKRSAGAWKAARACRYSCRPLLQWRVESDY